MTIDARVHKALETGRLVDVTTTGRKSGKPTRMEIPVFNVEGRLFIVGDPRTHDEKRELRPRDWYANVVADHRCTVHLKTSFVVDLPSTRPLITNLLNYDDLVEADVPAQATPVTDPVERRRVFSYLLPRLRG